MRTIKFRGKNVLSAEWVYGGITAMKDGWCSAITTLTEDEFDSQELVYPETIGQFTGLLDKNGREIYEGDILEVCEMYAKVVWNEEKASFEYQYLHPMQLTNTFYEFNMPYLSIIGNIHDNPELIKSKEINL